MAYDEEDFLLLSGLQHFKYCRRQWALIHIETQWAENFLTVDGKIKHENAHDKGFREHRRDLIVTRGLSVFSRTLGATGECDVVEFHASDSGIALNGQSGLWQPYPVEYKRGKHNDLSADSLQLCGQAMCLEEMLCCDIPEGALYHNETRHRTVVPLTEELRNSVRECLIEMHDLYRRGHTPNVKPKKGCSSCSMADLCLPKLINRRSVGDYLRETMEDTT